MIPENWAEKPPPTSFLPFHQGLGLCHTSRIPKVPILQIHTQIPPISNIFYRLPTLSTFQNTSHTQKYSTQDHGAYGRPICSPTTVHTNIPGITVTLLPKEL